MPDFAEIIPASYQNVSPGFLETLIQARREELFTGLMRLTFISGEDFLAGFLEGTQQKLYHCHGAVSEVIPRQTWRETFGRGGASVGFLPLPLEAMRFVRVIHEVPVRQIEETTINAEELADAVAKWCRAQDPGIIHIQGGQVDRYYLIAGTSTPVIEELSILGGETRFSLNDASFPKTLPKLEYHVLRYLSEPGHDLWREYELRLAFHPFMRMLLSRFSELAGRVLTERLCEQMSTWASREGWNVSLSSNGIVNRQYFDSLENATRFYVELVERFSGEARPALGARMTENILQEILMKLDSYRRELLTRSILPPRGAASESGVAWRQNL
jgi:hypothetical protein